METFWDASKGYFTGPLLTEQMIRSAESALGYKLPDSYVGILQVRNGGTPLRCCFPTVEPTSWAKDHIRISGIRGIGGFTWKPSVRSSRARGKKRGILHVERHPDGEMRLCPACNMKVWPVAKVRPDALPRPAPHARDSAPARARRGHRVQRVLRHRDVKTTTGTYGHQLHSTTQ